MTADDSEKQLRRDIAARPEDAPARRRLAELVGSDRTRKVEAIALWQSYVDRVEAESQGEALLQLARAQIEARRDSEALTTLECCVSRAPELAVAFDLLGDLLARAGRLDEAATALERAVELEPERIRPRLALAACLDALGRGQEASHVLRAAAELGGDDPAVQALIRELAHRRG